MTRLLPRRRDERFHQALAEPLRTLGRRGDEIVDIEKAPADQSLGHSIAGAGDDAGPTPEGEKLVALPTLTPDLRQTSRLVAEMRPQLAQDRQAGADVLVADSVRDSQAGCHR